MTRKKPKAKTGRPLIKIDPKVVEGMASVGATDEEIGGFLGCTGQTIRTRFLDLLSKSRNGLRVRLRQRQVKLAMEGNPTMLIWLGKNMLGQTDRQEFTGPDGGPIQHQDVTFYMPKNERDGS